MRSSGRQRRRAIPKRVREECGDPGHHGQRGHHSTVSDTAQNAPVRRLQTPTGWTLVALVVAMCFLAAVVGWNVGRGRSPAKSSADVGFLYDMIRHHESAVEMSLAELNHGTEEGVKIFAREILLQQSYEIGVMQAWLDHWGYRRSSPPASAMAWMGHHMRPEKMPGLPSAADMRRLDTARGRELDALFVALMSAHHAGGVHMAEEAADRASNDYVRALAARMAAVQRAEIAEMEGARTRASLPTVQIDAPVTLRGATRR